MILTCFLYSTEGNPGPTWDGGGGGGGGTVSDSGGFGAVLREFGACGGLALVAARLPRPQAAPAPPPPVPHHHDLDWVKVDDPYEVIIYEVYSFDGGFYS